MRQRRISDATARNWRIRVMLASFSGLLNSMCISAMASWIRRKDCTMLLKTTGFHSSFSFLLKPWAYINFICLSTVDFPDSPAPGNRKGVSGLQIRQCWLLLRQRTQQQKLHFFRHFLFILADQAVQVARAGSAAIILRSAPETHVVPIRLNFGGDWKIRERELAQTGGRKNAGPLLQKKRSINSQTGCGGPQGL